MVKTAMGVGSLGLGLLLTSPLAVAQEDSEPLPHEEVAPEEVTEVATDGARRRRATTVMGGIERVSDAFGTTLSAPMGGFDVAFGTQINDTLGVYVPFHLSFGNFQGLGTVAGIPAGLTGTLALTAVVDATFADRFSLGAGGGVGILNNPTGPCIHLRAAGYPVVNRDPTTNRRKGMVVAVDLRMIYARGFKATFPALSVGYAVF